MAVIELGIFVDKHASTKARKQAEQIVDGRKCIEIDLRFISGAHRLPPGIPIAGGDGSIRNVVQDMVNKNQVRPIGLLGGGTNDALYNSLRAEGQGMPYREFHWKTLAREPFDPKALIKPGLVGNQAYVMEVGFGQFEQSIGEANQSLNGYSPRRIRVPIAYFLGFIKTISQPDGLTPVNIYTTSPRMGRKHVFPQQTHHADLITHAWMEAQGQERIVSLAKTAFLWSLSKPSPYVRTEQKTEFEVDLAPKNLWINGDIIPNKQKSPLLISRWEQTIPIVPITY